MAKGMFRLIYAWFSVGQLVLAEFINYGNFTVNSSSSLCDAQSFLASIKTTKKQYKIFDSGNLEIHRYGVTWIEAENVCINKKFCPSCILPEPMNEDEKYVLRKLAENCSVKKPFIGMIYIKHWRWKHAGTPVKILEPDCESRYWHLDQKKGCGRMDNRTAFCKIDCNYPYGGTHKSFICEILPGPATTTQQPTQATEPDSESKDDTPSLSITTIAGIVVASVVGLVILIGLVYLCVNKNRSEPRTENPSPNTHQSQPLAGSAPQAQQYPGNFSQPPVSEPYTQGQPGLAYGPPEPAYTFGPSEPAYAPEPAYTFGSPGPAYAQAPPSPSFSAPPNTGATPGSTYIEMQPSPYYTQVPSSPYYSYEPPPPPVGMYPPPYYRERTTCTVS